MKRYIQTARELDPDDQTMLDELQAMGVEARILFNRSSSRGFNVSEGEANLILYVPEELYSKEFKSELEHVIGKHNWYNVLERRGRTSDGRIKLRVM